MLQTEFEFTLPKGYLDSDGNLHRKGVMRLSRAMDEIVPMRDPRVKSNPAYATVIILSRVITRLGALEEVSPAIVEGFFACDLNYLQQFYRHINELEQQNIEIIEAAPASSEPLQTS
jgi:phosphoketolase